MSEQESAGEKSETMAQPLTDPQDPPGGGAGQVEGVVEGVMDQTVFYPVDTVPPVNLMILFGLQVISYMFYKDSIYTVNFLLYR